MKTWFQRGVEITASIGRRNKMGRDARTSRFEDIEMGDISGVTSANVRRGVVVVALPEQARASGLFAEKCCTYEADFIRKITSSNGVHRSRYLSALDLHMQTLPRKWENLDEVSNFGTHETTCSATSWQVKKFYHQKEAKPNQSNLKPATTEFCVMDRSILPRIYGPSFDVNIQDFSAAGDLHANLLLEDNKRDSIHQILSKIGKCVLVDIFQLYYPYRVKVPATNVIPRLLRSPKIHNIPKHITSNTKSIPPQKQRRKLELQRPQLTSTLKSAKHQPLNDRLPTKAKLSNVQPKISHLSKTPSIDGESDDEITEPTQKYIEEVISKNQESYKKLLKEKEAEITAIREYWDCDLRELHEKIEKLQQRNWNWKLRLRFEVTSIKEAQVKYLPRQDVDIAMNKIRLELETMTQKQDFSSRLSSKEWFGGDLDHLDHLVNSAFASPEESIDGKLRLKRLALRIGSSAVLSLLTITALRDWVFLTDFPRVELGSLSLIEAYRSIAFSQKLKSDSIITDDTYTFEFLLNETYANKPFDESEVPEGFWLQFSIGAYKSKSWVTQDERVGALVQTRNFLSSVNDDWICDYQKNLYLSINRAHNPEIMLSHSRDLRILTRESRTDSQNLEQDAFQPEEPGTFEVAYNNSITIDKISEPMRNIPQLPLQLSDLSSEHMCKICKRNFEKNQGLRVHQRNKTCRRCKACRKVWPTIVALKEHTSKNHNEEIENFASSTGDHVEPQPAAIPVSQRETKSNVAIEEGIRDESDIEKNDIEENNLEENDIEKKNL
ncbi:hypothetical protein BCON_0172g00190 [Botryotinia convoluta]|uniref:C2H2-type domain-containing protein n=1 Tax=Botryotinia convoluta TaxID=54673 RepID=A0A4Z1HV21_9HELO|nr:hypothetical protein BCON_0172g00190 [Botryotinia convoluta]